MAQKQEGLAIGIDLGTTYSCVGVWRSGRVEIIPNELGHKKTPSYVAFSDTRRLIGEEAKSRVSSNSTNTIFNVKRLMGRRSIDNSRVNELWPFKVEFDPKNHRCVLSVNYNGKEKRFSPEEISSMLLMKMRQIAEAYLGTTVRNAVISVPAHFNTAQRQATMDAGVIAGLNVMSLINEPSAAAFAYGFDRSAGSERGKNVLIFDLGGGTLDVSLLKIGQGTVKVMSTAGDTHLGGEDFDQAMVNHCIEEFKKKHEVDLGGNLKAVRRLKAACEKAKIELSVTNQATIEIDCLYEEIDFSSSITCDQFVKLNSPLLEKCKEIVERCLRDANEKSKDIDEVLLVGGSSRVPMVQDMLRRRFNKELCKAINADEAVAYGATLQAAMLTYREGNKEVPRLVLEDATPLDLRVSDNHTPMCRKNTTIPPKHGLKCPFQWHSVRSLDVYEDRYLLGRLSSSNNPVKWTHFVIDENGMWSALGWDTNTNQETKAAIPMGRLNEEEKQRMVREAEKYDFQDKEHNKRVEEKNSLEKFIYDVRKAINDKKMEDRLDTADKKKIEAAIEEVIEWLSTSSSIEVKEYKKKMVQLQGICHPILSKLHKEKEKETDDSSPNGDAGSSALARYTHSSNDAGKSKGKRPHSDNIAESKLAIGTSHGASGTVENKGISRPKTDVKNVSPGGNVRFESVVVRSCCGGPITSKLGIRFGDGDSKVQIIIETKVKINGNQLDTTQHHTILPEVEKWVKDVVGLHTHKQISGMLKPKIVSNTRSSSSGHRSSSRWCCWFRRSSSKRWQL